MAERRTVALDDALVKKIRGIQSKQIKEFTKFVSFSSVVNEQLRKVLDGGKSE